MSIAEQAKALVVQMTLEEKASLCSGADFWHTKGIQRLGLPSFMITDGPHGLRKQVEQADHLGINNSVPATCFPAAASTACSFDRLLLKQIGIALGEECREEEVAVILGPGLSIKRSPLCGRNFEYFSEDPYLTGELGAAYIEGVQSQNVGVSMKHFALNNQEKRRMTEESVCDMRAIREIYLAGFERAVKKAHPWTVMSSYVRIHGEFASDNHWLLTEVLRNEWGHDGIVVSDWGGTNDRVRAIAAGMDLEMPSLSRISDHRVVQAVKAGVLTMDQLDACAARVTELILKSMQRQPLSGSKPAHHDLAKRAERESAVLLKNEGGLLPGKVSQSAAVIGVFAKSPRYQGAGSSKINPTHLDNAYDEFIRLGVSFDYAPGYNATTDVPDEALIVEACRVSAGKDIVYIFAGLPDYYESEGFDRDKMIMPENHSRLIEAVAKVNPNVVVVLSGGSVIDMAWEGSAKAILMGYLSGQAGASALCELLLGYANPSGKLAETWPLHLEDNPSYAYFPGYEQSVEYRESIYVGYRYYDAAGKAVRYPFGYGLSYTSFAYANLRVSGDVQSGITVKADITNTGERPGAEIAQLYITPPESRIYKAPQELKGFEKVVLQPGETKTIEYTLDRRAFAFYDVNAQDWRVENGEYEVRVGTSSRDIRLTGKVVAVNADAFNTPVPDYHQSAFCYYDLSNGIANVPDEAFIAVYGSPLPPLARRRGDPFTINSTMTDIQEKWIGRMLFQLIKKQTATMFGDDAEMRRMADGVMADAPLRILMVSGKGQVTPDMLDGLADLLNGHLFRGMMKVLKK